MEKAVIAVVPSAGLGRRFGPDQRKTFFELDGIPLLAHALKRLQSESLVSEIVPVMRNEDLGTGRHIADQYAITKARHIIPGGRERQDSIYNALNFISNTLTDTDNTMILVHDGVRPWFDEGLIREMTDALNGFDGVVPAIALKDTIKEIDTSSIVVSTLNRDTLRAVQTPQLFPFTTLKRSYDNAMNDGHYGTDDASLVERTGGKIRIIEGSPWNIKVTTPVDVEMLQYLFCQDRISHK